jgi:hypothetical protein
MTETLPLFDLLGSYIEIDGWIIVDINPETGSIHQNEDYELSAESFLAQLSRMQMPPSLQMPIPSTVGEVEHESETRTTNHEGVRDAKGGTGEDNRAKDTNHDGGLATKMNGCTTSHTHLKIGGEPTSARQRTERHCAEITSDLTTSSDIDDENQPTTKDTLEAENGRDTPDSGDFGFNDPPPKDGSGSAHTDPDFVHSSSDSASEWVLGSGMAGLSVSDSLFMVESKRAKSLSTEDGRAGEGVAKESEDVEEPAGHGKAIGDGIKVPGDDEVVTGTLEDEGEESQKNDEIASRGQRRKDRRNVSLAASATAVMLAAIWLMERKYDLS